jgi:hypothetical protein
VSSQHASAQKVAGFLIVSSVPIGMIIGWAVARSHGVVVGVIVGIFVPCITILGSGVLLVGLKRSRRKH